MVGVIASEVAVLDQATPSVAALEVDDLVLRVVSARRRKTLADLYSLDTWYASDGWRSGATVCEVIDFLMSANFPCASQIEVTRAKGMRLPGRLIWLPSIGETTSKPPKDTTVPS